jgi:RNA polymerase sigma factor (sigma-70 family)
VNLSEVPVAWDDILEFMDELKRAARSLLANEASAGSVLTTQLVNSALKKLKPKDKQWQDVNWSDRASFFKDAHFAMRRLLVDYARRRKTRAHVQVGSFETECVVELTAAGQLDFDRLVQDAAASAELAEAVDAALEDLDRQYPELQLSAIVQHRVFDGLTQEEIGKLLDITDRTVRTRQKLAYALLRKALRQHFASS